MKSIIIVIIKRRMHFQEERQKTIDPTPNHKEEETKRGW
jgi:hypothetical protein